MSDELITNSIAKPCGCVVNTKSDGREGTMPCFGHGMLEVAGGLAHASAVLQAMAARAIDEAQQQEMLEIASRIEAANGPKGIVE